MAIIGASLAQGFTWMRAFQMKGEKSVGVAHQWNGRLGEQDNCPVGVFGALGQTDPRERCLNCRSYTYGPQWPASFLYRFCRPPCAASPRNLQTTFDRETFIRVGGASRSAGLRTDHGHNELEHSENVHAGLYAHLASSPSMAKTRRGSSAVTSGANRATTSPLRLSRNFSKFHSTSAEFSEFTP